MTYAFYDLALNNMAFSWNFDGQRAGEETGILYTANLTGRKRIPEKEHGARGAGQRYSK
jgi:hypothetical protein